MSRVTVVLEQWQADALDMLAASQRRQEGVPASRSSVLRELLDRALQPYKPQPAPAPKQAQPVGCSPAAFNLPQKCLRN